MFKSYKCVAWKLNAGRHAYDTLQIFSDANVCLKFSYLSADIS